MRGVDHAARAIVRIFYRVDAVGAVPADGPLILLPNHPNALLDPAVVMATSDRPVRFLAKSTLFNGPLRPLLSAAGAIPVFRRQDDGVDVSRNAEMFAAVQAALARGDAVCIFPEGTSHSTGRLEPLRTGAARMALAAAAAGVDVRLVPVGINPDEKTAFRSRMTVVYGVAFGVPAGSSVASLTADITERMRHLIVEADPDADAALVMRIDRLYASERRTDPTAQAAVERRRAIAAGVTRLRETDPDRYQSALLQLRRYDERLRRFRLRDVALDWTTSTGDAVRFLLRELPLALVLAPIAAAAVILFAVPYTLTSAAARLQRASDVTATTKVVAGTVLYLGWMALLVGWTGSRLGTAAGAAAAVALPVIAIAGLLAIERESAAWRTARSWLALRGTRPATRQRLRRHRAELADVLDQLSATLTRDLDSGGTSRRT